MSGESTEVKCDSSGLVTFIYAFNHAFIQEIVIEYLVGARLNSEKRSRVIGWLRVGFRVRETQLKY